MRLNVASKIISLAVAALVAAAIASCGSVTSSADGGTAGTSAGGTAGAAGTGTGTAGTHGTAGTSGAAGTTGSGGMGGTTGLGGAGGGPLTCRTDVAGDCPSGFTCACGGPGPISAASCTCHRNCTDANQCPTAEPMCGCPSTVGGARFCVNACFCSCQ